MKKFTAILLTMIYLSVNVPVAVSLHYCAGKLSGVDFSLKQITKSCVCGSEKSKSCCSDQVLVFNSADVHHNSHAVKLTPTTFDLLYTNNLPVYEFSKPAVLNHLSYNEYKNPPPGKEPLYILNRVLII